MPHVGNRRYASSIDQIMGCEGKEAASEVNDMQEKKMVPPRRFERPAYGLGNRRSIHLSYGGNRWYDHMRIIGGAEVYRNDRGETTKVQI